MTTAHPDASQQAVVEAALVLLERMGLTPADLAAIPQPRKPVPTFAEYIPVVSAAVSAGTRRAYGSYWNRVIEHWGDRRLDEPTPSEIRQLMTYIKTHVVTRRNARGGRSAEEHLVAALRCLYQRAVDDGLIAEADNPARKVAKPRRLPTTRRALPDTRLAQINQIAAATGDDPELDTLLLRLHTETACRRGGALALRPRDLDPDQCLVLLREKGETVRWQPVSPTLMARLTDHGQERHAPADGPLLRYAGGRPITRRRYDHLWTRAGRHLPWVAIQGISTHWIRHILDLGRAELRVRRRPRLRRAHRQRQRGRRHGDLRPRQPVRSRRRASRADRRAPPARHDGRVVNGMAALTADASLAADPGPRGPGPARTAGPATADRSPSAARPGRAVRSWPLLVLAAAGPGRPVRG
jgi:site-specific recombinase XerD